jgi:hypothetical protein
MKRTYRFARPVGTVRCAVSGGKALTIPVFPGVLKHPSASELPRLLKKPAVLRKYTIQALRTAAWPILREFPKAWLLTCLPDAGLREGRERAIRFLLS